MPSKPKLKKSGLFHRATPDVVDDEPVSSGVFFITDNHDVMQVEKNADGSFQMPSIPKGRGSTESSDIWTVAQKYLKSKRNDSRTSFSIGENVPLRDAETLEEAKAQAKDFIGDEIENLDDGFVATVSGNTVSKMTSKSVVKKSVSEEIHSHAVANLDLLYATSIRSFSKNDSRKGDHIKQIHRYRSPFYFEGKIYIAKLTLKEFKHDSEGNRIYSVEVDSVVELKEGEAPSVPTLSEEEAGNQHRGFEGKLLQRIKDVKKAEDLSLSIGETKMKDTLITDVFKRMKNPETRVKIMQDIARRLSDTKRDVDKIGRAFGKDYTQKAIVEPRTKKSLKEEAATISQRIIDEEENSIYEDFGELLANEEFSRLSDQPVTSRILEEGGFESKTAASKRLGGKKFLGGEYDGLAGFSIMYYGGTESPDQMARIRH